MRSWGMACLVLALSCGGVSQRDGSSDDSDALGGAGAANAGKGGSATASSGDAGAPGAAGSVCSEPPLGCDASATYVDVSDTTTVRLAYAADASSAACQILATGVERCGTVNLRLSACSAPNGDGVCLDTASTEPHYTDASGQRWTMLSLSGRSSPPNGEQAEAMVDLDLTLALGSDATYHELPAHAHVCAAIAAALVPCK